MSAPKHERIIYGDFQTPASLCDDVCTLLNKLQVSPRSVLEPTCGTGAFLRASVRAFPGCPTFLGFEIDDEYVQVARTVEKATVCKRNFFDENWWPTLQRLPEPFLILGNPPWVTNSAVGALKGANRPTKSNVVNLSGMDAITGKSNFDISEWMMTRLLESANGRSGVLAMLCKTGVARRVLQRAWSTNITIEQASMYLIDAGKHFGVAVEACLLICNIEKSMGPKQCAVHVELRAESPQSGFGWHSGRLVANLATVERLGHLYGPSPIRWRSGIKHDCAAVMELRSAGDERFENGFGEVVRLESTCLYPMLKSSELMKAIPVASRHMLETQRAVKEDTEWIKTEAPQTWNYLMSHSRQLEDRASSVYRGRARFSIFGVGSYSFAPWKVAISGFYKRLEFRCIGPVGPKPVMLDDTCYFLPCQTEDDARFLTKLLNSETAKDFLMTFIFWDLKRPVTSHILGSLDIRALAAEGGMQWPEHLEERRNLPLFR